MITKDDLKDAYSLGLKSNHEIGSELLKQIGWSDEKIVSVINMLIEARLCVSKKKNNSDVVQIIVRDERIAQSLKTLTSNDYAVYCAIEASERSGIWTFDLCKVTGLQSHIVQRAVRTLCDTKKLIKPLRSIHQKNRKMYILANLEPAVEVVGGTFYKNAELDEEYIERLREQVVHILTNTTRMALDDLKKYIQTVSAEKSLTDEEIKLVLRSLELEQKLDSYIVPSTDTIYYSWCRWNDINIFSEIPCGVCSVSSECIQVDGDLNVNPTQCVYYSSWLGLNCVSFLNNLLLIQIAE